MLHSMFRRRFAARFRRSFGSGGLSMASITAFHDDSFNTRRRCCSMTSAARSDALFTINWVTVWFVIAAASSIIVLSSSVKRRSIRCFLSAGMVYITVYGIYPYISWTNPLRFSITTFFSRQIAHLNPAFFELQLAHQHPGDNKCRTDQGQQRQTLSGEATKNSAHTGSPV